MLRMFSLQGQTCMDLVDPSISTWLAEASLKAPRRVNNNNNNNNNNKRKRSPPRHDVKRVELQITGQTDKIVNGKSYILIQHRDICW